MQTGSSTPQGFTKQREKSRLEGLQVQSEEGEEEAQPQVHPPSRDEHGGSGSQA